MPPCWSRSARVVLPLPDETIVLSGHGPATYVGHERATNPFLAEAAPSALLGTGWTSGPARYGLDPSGPARYGP